MKKTDKTIRLWYKAQHSLRFALWKQNSHVSLSYAQGIQLDTKPHVQRASSAVPRSQSFYLQFDFPVHHERHQAKDCQLPLPDKRIVWGLTDSWVSLKSHSIAAMPLSSGSRRGIIGQPGGTELGNSVASLLLVPAALTNVPSERAFADSSVQLLPW